MPVIKTNNNLQFLDVCSDKGLTLIMSAFQFLSQSMWNSSSETQGRLAGARGNKSGKEMKRRMFTSKAERAPWEPTLTRPFPNGSTNAASGLGRKILCIILPNRGTAASEVLWCVLTRLLSHRHTCFVRLSMFCMRGKLSF